MFRANSHPAKWPPCDALLLPVLHSSVARWRSERRCLALHPIDGETAALSAKCVGCGNVAQRWSCLRNALATSALHFHVKPVSLGFPSSFTLSAGLGMCISPLSIFFFVRIGLSFYNFRARQCPPFFISCRRRHADRQSFLNGQDCRPFKSLVVVVESFLARLQKQAKAMSNFLAF